MKTILIVDDNAHIVNVIQDYVKKEGYDSITAFDGEDALLKFRQFNPSLILIDLMLPKMDGFGVCKAVRNESDIPIIIMSARSDDEDIINGFKAGADDYVTKPYSPQLLMARIKTVLRRTNSNLADAVNKC
jgi:DNA-binding response OmpR family regulator